MLRQLLEISPAVRQGWRMFTPSHRALTSVAAAEPAQPPAAEPPNGGASGDWRPTSNSAWRWLQRLRSASAAGDADACAAILAERLHRTSGTSAWTSRAFAEVLRILPAHKALKVYHLSRAHRVEPSSTMAVSVIRMHAALGMLRHVEGVVGDMIAAGLRPHWTTYFHWAAVHAEAGDPDGVRRAAAAADAAGLEVTAHYQTMMIKALCKSGQPHAALHLLHDVRREGTPPEPVWRALVHCHGMAGHARRAAAIFDEMRSAGVEPGQSTWTALVNAYSECHMPREAQATMEKMRAAGFQGNHQSYTSLIKAFSQIGDVPAAEAAVAQMRRDGLQPNAQVWGALIATHAMAGDVAGARRALLEMSASGVKPSVVQYTSMLSAYRAGGDLAGALGTLAEMDAAGVKPSMATFTELITLLGEHGMVEEAEQAFRAISAQGHTPDHIAYNVLAAALLRCWVDAGRAAGADLLLRAEEVFKQGWVAGATAPERQLSTDQKLLRINLHWQGTWSAQLAMLSVLNELLAVWGTARTPALMVITGQGLKKRAAPLRDVAMAMLRRMGVPARVSRANSGTIIVGAGGLARLLQRVTAQGETFDVRHAHGYLVDPRVAGEEAAGAKAWADGSAPSLKGLQLGHTGAISS